MTDREFRLRLRIDRLQDERDDALHKLAETRDQRDRSRDQRDRYRERVYALTKQLAFWKTKAERRGALTGKSRKPR